MTFIGAAIKRERTAAGMTSKQLAERTGLSQQYVGDVQHGRRVPSVETMLKIANVFPDVDSARWLILLLRDLWGAPIVDLISKHIIAAHEQGEERRPAPADPPA